MNRTGLWVITIAVFVVFGPSLFAGFVSDDVPLITKNQFAHSLDYLGRCFTTDLWDVSLRVSGERWSKFYRPLVTSSYILNWVLGKGAAWPFHLVNVLAHWGAALLAFRMARRWLNNSTVGLAAALVFALHPTRDDSVIWISGRTDVFMGLFLLLSLELFVAAARRDAARAWLFSIGGVLSWIAALLSKEYALILPVLLTVEVLLAAKPEGPSTEKRRLGAATLVSVVLAGAYLWLRAAYFSIRPEGLESPPILIHAHYVLVSLGRYVIRTVFPWPQVLMYRPVEVVDGRVILPWFDTAVGVLALVAFLVALVWTTRRNRIDGAILAAIGLCALPILNIAYTGFSSTTADRFYYFLLLLVAIGFGRVFLLRWRPKRSPLAPVIMGGVGLICAGIAWTRTLDYTSEYAFWMHEAEVNPDVPMGWSVLSGLEVERGDVSKGYEYMRRAYSDKARRYVLLAEPASYYVSLLDLKAGLTPDGAVRDLAALNNQLVALARGELRRTDAYVGDLPLDVPVQDQNLALTVRSHQPTLAAQAAFVASRIGRDDIVEEMARAVRDDDRIGWQHRHGLAVALTRAGLYRMAEHQIDLLRATTSNDEGLASFKRDVDAVRRLREEAKSRSGTEAALLARAEAEFLMAAWLRAARILRVPFLESASSQPVWSAYVRALSNCRLDEEAYRAARARLDHEAAVKLLAELNEEMSPRVRSAPAVTPGIAWWK